MSVDLPFSAKARAFYAGVAVVFGILSVLSPPFLFEFPLKAMMRLMAIGIAGIALLSLSLRLRVSRSCTEARFLWFWFRTDFPPSVRFIPGKGKDRSVLEALIRRLFDGPPAISIVDRDDKEVSAIPSAYLLDLTATSYAQLLCDLNE